MEYITVREAAEKWNVSERRITMLCRNKKIIGIKKDGYSWLIPSDASKPLDGRTKEASISLHTSTTLKKSISFTTNGGAQRVIDVFKKKYKREPAYTSFTPYRICPLGAHVDHNLGKYTGFAIDKGIHIAYGPKRNGIIEIESLQFPKRGQWHVSLAPSEKENDWADTLRGATIALNEKYPLRVGLCAVVDGELPIGGLSSSSAIIVSFINALCNLNDIDLTKEELIEIASISQNDYIGVGCGNLDVMLELYAKKDSLLFVDSKDEIIELIKKNKSMKDFKIAIFFSGVDNNLSSEKYNMRADELRSASYAIKAFNNDTSCKFYVSNMRDIPYEEYLKHSDKLPENWKKRADHFYEETKRVEKGIKAWNEGNLEEFGKLITESGKSTINNWETVSKELIDLFNIIISCKGVYGSRFIGSGFKGCCFALIDNKYSDDIINEVYQKYTSLYENLKNKFSAHICSSADGIHL